jgi:hypothetical protein
MVCENWLLEATSARCHCGRGEPGRRERFWQANQNRPSSVRIPDRTAGLSVSPRAARKLLPTVSPWAVFCRLRLLAPDLAACNNSSEEVNKFRGFIAVASISKMKAALQLVRERGTVRPRDLAARNIPADYLYRLNRLGLVDRVSRGLYAWPEAQITEHHSLAEAARQISRGVVCLLSALRFHRLTTQSPHEVWMAIPPKAWMPKIEYPKLRFLRFSGEAFTGMVQEREVEGVVVRVYSIAKTVADCFKYRNKVGVEVALEALRDCWRGKRATMDELWEAARVCRMTNVMRPYLEAIV